MEEVWKDILEYEGLYQISNLGRVKNNKNLIMKNRITPNGYYKIALSKDGICKHYNIHRLLAIAFIPNPDNKPYVDHIDINKKNNDLSNLRWVTNSENVINRKQNLTLSGLQNISEIHINDRIYYRVKIKRNYIRVIDKSFKVLDDAITYRDNYLNNLIDE